MNKILASAIVMVGVFVLMASCKKDKASSPETKTIDVTLAADLDYSLDLGGFGDEEGAIIYQQAMHYQTSLLTRNNNGIITYTYKPVPGYIGTDEVVLKTEKGSDGVRPNTTIQLITIRFTFVTK